jgi:hypothetical protein
LFGLEVASLYSEREDIVLDHPDTREMVEVKTPVVIILTEY